MHVQADLDLHAANLASLVYLMLSWACCWLPRLRYVVRFQERAHTTETTLRMSVEKTLEERI